MKTFSTAILLAVCLGSPLWAAPGPRPTGPPPAPVNNMAKALDLTAEQRPQIQKIMSSMPAGPGRQQAILKVLNPAQQAKFRAMVAKASSHPKPRR